MLDTRALNLTFVASPLSSPLLFGAPSTGVLEDPTEVLGCGLRWNAVYEPSPELRSQYEAFMASEGYAATAGVKSSHIFASSSISASGSSASEGACTQRARTHWVFAHWKLERGFVTVVCLL